jgi:hypothetical protein
MTTTRLNIKVSIDDELEYDNGRFKEFVTGLTNKDVHVQYVEDSFYYCKLPVYYIDYEQDESAELKQHIKDLIEHKTIPVEGFEDIEPIYDVSIENKNVDEAFSYLVDRKYYSAEERLDIVDHVLAEIVTENRELSDKIDALYDFMDSSGLLYYRQVMELMVKTFEENGFGNFSDVLNHTTNTIH